jgi:hypothetical protein
MGLEDIIYLRFANTMLEPVWNRNCVSRANHDGRELRRWGLRSLLIAWCAWSRQDMTVELGCEARSCSRTRDRIAVQITMAENFGVEDRGHTLAWLHPWSSVGDDGGARPASAVVPQDVRCVETLIIVSLGVLRQRRHWAAVQLRLSCSSVAASASGGRGL